MKTSFQVRCCVLTLVAAAFCAESSITYAQESPPPTYEINLSAQSLSNSLVALSEQTGVQLIISAELARGRTATEVTGRFTLEQALARVLAGTGLTYRLIDARTIAIERARSTSERVLGPVRVEGSGYTDGRLSGVNGSRDHTATEGTGSYTSDALTIGSKAPQTMRETPQSVSVISQERMQDQNITDLTQALSFATGVTLVQGDPSGEQGDTSLQTTFYSRGFPISSIQIDGGAPLQTSFSSGSTGWFLQIDMAQYDHVEVLRGAAGLLNGYGNPSGTVNLVRKKPLDHGQVVWEGQVGSWSSYRAVLDATGPLGFDGVLRGRLVMTYEDKEHFYRIAKDNKTLAYGVLESDLSSSTLLTAGVSYTRQDSVPWFGGLPRYENGDDLRLPRDVGLLFPWNRWDFDTTEIFGSLEQRLGENWSARLNLTHNSQESSRKLGSSSGTVSPNTFGGPALSGEMRDYASDQLSAEVTLAGELRLWGQPQKILIGANNVRTDGSGMRAYSSLVRGTSAAPYVPYPGGPRYCNSPSTCPDGYSPQIDVFGFDPRDPLYSEPRAALPDNYFHERGQEQSGIYINANLTAFDRWHMATGLRFSRYEYFYNRDQLCTVIPTSGTPAPFNCVGRSVGDPYSPDVRRFADNDFTWPPAIALSYDITPELTTYVGYTDIYVSQASNYTADIEPVDPITGANMEIGLKWAPKGGRLNAAASLYRIQQEGFAVFDVSRSVVEDGVFYSIANNGQRFRNAAVDDQHSCCYLTGMDITQLSQGFDAELTGEILPGWQISAGYTWNENEYRGADIDLLFDAAEGQRLVSRQPEHLFKLWTRYSFGAAGRVGPDTSGWNWMRGLAVSGGVNWQSDAFQSGSACTQYGPPDQQGVSQCVTNTPYSYTQEAYAVWSARVDYELNDSSAVSLNLNNVADKRYYQTMGTSTGGNWYGEPLSYTLTFRHRF